MLARLDDAYARLHPERRGLDLAKEAVRSINTAPMTDTQPEDDLSIGELAIVLGM